MRSGAGPIFVLCLLVASASSSTFPSPAGARPNQDARAMEANQQNDMTPQEVVQGGPAPAAEEENVEDAASPSLPTPSPETPQNPEEDTDDETTDEAAEDVSEEADEEVTEVSTEEVTEVSTKEVTEVSTEEVTKVSTEEVTEVSTEEVTEVSTEEITEGAAPEAPSVMPVTAGGEAMMAPTLVVAVSVAICGMF